MTDLENKKLCDNCGEYNDELDLTYIVEYGLYFCPKCYKDYLDTVIEDMRTQEQYDFDFYFDNSRELEQK